MRGGNRVAAAMRESVDNLNNGGPFAGSDGIGAAFATVPAGATSAGMAGGVMEYRVMFIPIGAASSALSYLQSLLAMGASGAGDANGANPISTLLDGQSGSDPTTSAPPPATASTGSTSGSNQPTFDAGMMAALISLQSQQSQSTSGAAPQGPSQLFAKLDTDGDGQISKSEFETALGSDGVDATSADALFGKLDANGDGSISQSELTQARHGGGGHHHHMHAGGGATSRRYLWAKPDRRTAVVGQRQWRANQDRHQFGRFDHHDYFLCRRQHGRDDHAGSIDG